MEATQERVNPFAAAPDGKKKLFLIGLLLCVFGSIMQSTTLSIILPMAAQEVGGQDIYSLASTLGAPLGIVGMPLYGYLAARNPSLKVPLMVASYVVGCAVLALRFVAWDMWIIIIAMVFWGVVSPATFVLGYSLIRYMFDAKKAGAYLGMCGTAMMLASLIGPIGGGALMGMVGWRLFNFVILPFMLVGALCIAFSVKVTKEEMAPFARAGSSFDVIGTIGLTLFLCGLILGLSLGTGLAPFGSMMSNILFVVAVVGLAILIVAMKQRQAEAIIPAPALKNRNVLAFTLANFCGMFSNMALFFFLPSYIIYVIFGGEGSFQAGIVMACLSLLGVFLSPWFGGKIGKMGTAKPILALSAVLRAITNVLLVVYLTMSGAEASWIVLAAIMLVLGGVYNATHTVSFSAGPQVQLPEDVRLQGNAVIQAGQNIGSGVGTAVYSVIIGMAGITGGMPVALIVAAVFACLTLVCALFLQKLPTGGTQA